MLRSSTFNPDLVPMPFGNALLLSVIGVVMVFLMLILLAGMIQLLSMAIRKISGENKKSVEPKKETVNNAPVKTAPAVVEEAEATGLTLTDVDEPTAAVVMALVSHETGIPLNHLNFKSIKGIVELDGVDEREAAVIMALTAHQMGKPVENLVFKSIKKI